MTPDQIKLCVIATVCAIALAAAGYGGWTLNGWRLSGQIERLEREKKAVVDQAAVLSSGLEACSAGVDAAAAAGDEVLKLAGKLLDASKKVHADGLATAGRLEDLLKNPTPAGAGCNEAWAKLEADWKTRAAP